MTRSITALIVAAHNHASAEALGDIDAILATMEGEPVYDFYPVGRRFSGMDRTRRYYRHFVDNVMPRIAGYQLHQEWLGEGGVVQEYSVDVRDESGDGLTRHRILGILTFGEALLSGERLYADEAFFRILIGPIWDELEPIA
ncbi:hypothetical protein SAMN06295912_11070 [Sphingomonas laterariae]|uniref:SnoaL-like domain-containing protein n=1 Tax=Edaphosphingomonas laterariae TaxID=861865 RepID=A0A239FWM8_9SPHN|nr:hypothetical protein [Sphingomonas laterariae]SNS61170.1 hypothetical protein SAMN06295912_11070 [Sphingomonas laterariae]